MDAVSACALGAPGVALCQQGHVARPSQFAQPQIQGRVDAGSILAKQNASNVSHVQDFGH
jgi:hypothetical protein